eukprot:m51a1_g14785 putative m-phase inducer phosphatase 3 isoform x1 (427) ;mRNA; r:471519-473346
MLCSGEGAERVEWRGCCAAPVCYDDEAPTDPEDNADDDFPVRDHLGPGGLYVAAALLPPSPRQQPVLAAPRPGSESPRCGSSSSSMLSPKFWSSLQHLRGATPPPPLSPAGPLLRPSPLAAPLQASLPGLGDPPEFHLNGAEAPQTRIVRSHSQLPQPDWTALTVQRKSSTPVLQRGCVLPLCSVREGHNCVDCDTVARLVRGEFAVFFDHVHLIDCRYPYEYDGGHIKGATNVTGSFAEVRTKLRRMFFGPDGPMSNPSRTAIVFHCEFSANRGPCSLDLMRNLDSRVTEASCDRPTDQVHTYEQVYLMDGGYKAFFAAHKELCDPQEYTPMEAESFKKEMLECKRPAAVDVGARSTVIRGCDDGAPARDVVLGVVAAEAVALGTADAACCAEVASQYVPEALQDKVPGDVRSAVASEQEALEAS